MRKTFVPMVKKLEALTNEIQSYASDLELIMSGLEEHKDSQSIEDLQETLKTALSDLDTLYCEIMGDDQNDEELSGILHRTEHR